jgi:SET domain
MTLSSSVLLPGNFVAALAPRRLGGLARWKTSCRLCSSKTSSTSFPDESRVVNFPIPVLDFIQGADWENRIALQAKWTNEEKGWQVPVEWKNTPYGVGLFAAADIPAETILRVGTNGNNLLQFQSINEIETFCQQGNDEYEARLHYVSDYLWGYSPANTDEKGYDFTKPSEDERFYGMWIPGNGLNHNPIPNTVYRTRKGGTDTGIVLVSIRSIAAGEELFDDYRRHGLAPKWLLEFARAKNVTLNFADCNDFVGAD